MGFAVLQRLFFKKIKHLLFSTYYFAFVHWLVVAVTTATINLVLKSAYFLFQFYHNISFRFESNNSF